jgi:hypothetical protein
MMRGRICFLLTTVFFSIWGQALAQQDFIVYPSQGQSQQKMEKDQFECHNWAKQQTGFDPRAASSSPPPDSQSSTTKGVVKGGAVGALGGLAIGSLSGNAGAGAAIGATAGGVFGGLKAKNKQDKSEQAQQQYYQQRLDEYNRACRACLIGRGYTVQ